MDKSTIQGNREQALVLHRFQANVICNGRGVVQLRDESVAYVCPLCAAELPAEQPPSGSISGRFTSTQPNFTEVARN